MSVESRVISVIGAGNLGANIAYFLSEQSIADTVLLFDSDEGRARGKALDIIESQPLRRVFCAVHGVTDIAQLKKSGIIIIALSKDMFPALSSADEQEQAIKDALSDCLPAFRGFAGSVIFASQISDEAMLVAQQALQIPPEAIVGVGTVAHTLYAQQIIAEQSGIDPTQIQALIVGNAQTPIIAPQCMRIAGIPIAHVLDEKKIVATVQSQLAKLDADLRSNYYRYAAAVATIAAAITYNLNRILTVSSIVAQQQYHTKLPLALPSIVSHQSVKIATTNTASEFNELLAPLIEGAK